RAAGQPKRRRRLSASSSPVRRRSRPGRLVASLLVTSALLAGTPALAETPPSIAAATATAAAEAATPLLGAKSRVLENGLTVVVVEDHRMPVVSHMVWYRVGAADEPARRSGIAHFLEHLMFKGTE